jgi:hypothetical protein
MGMSATSWIKDHKKLGLFRWMNSAASNNRGVSDHLEYRLAETYFSFIVSSPATATIVRRSRQHRAKKHILIISIKWGEWLKSSTCRYNPRKLKKTKPHVKPYIGYFQSRKIDKIEFFFVNSWISVFIQMQQTWNCCKKLNSFFFFLYIMNILYTYIHYKKRLINIVLTKALYSHSFK